MRRPAPLGWTALVSALVIVLAGCGDKGAPKAESGLSAAQEASRQRDEADGK